jgi:hypothetical protein
MAEPTHAELLRENRRLKRSNARLKDSLGALKLQFATVKARLERLELSEQAHDDRMRWLRARIQVIEQELSGRD